MSRELLEKAAKAAGIALTKWVEEWDGGAPASYMTLDGGSWNPLTDDGDALRLAVKLSLTVDIGHDKYSDVWAYPNKDTKRNKVRATESFNGDPYAATRLAIVRAAAAMGEKP